MPLFYFNLNTGSRQIMDRDGSDLPDEPAARAHAAIVAREVMRNDQNRTLSWRLEVSDSEHKACFDLLFAAAAEDLEHLPERMRDSVTQNAQRVATLNDDINAVRHTLRQLRATLSRADGVLYVASVNGRRVDS